MMKIILLTILTFIFLTNSVQALVLTNHIGDTNFLPGESKNIGYINVLNTDNETSVTVYDYSIFSTTLNPYSFSLTTDAFQNVSIDVTIPPYHQAMSYSMPIVFVSNDGLQQIDIPINILEHTNYSIASDTFSFNATHNEEIGYPIQITNLGNTDLSISGNTTSPYIAQMGNITVYLQQTFSIQTILFIPANSSEGFYQENLTLYINGEENNITFEFWLEDKIKPNITNIQFREEINFSETQIITFDILDNVGVKEISASVEIANGEIVDVEVVNNTIEFTQTELIGEYVLIIEAEDYAGNRISKPIIFEVVPIKVLYIESEIDYGKVKIQEVHYAKNIGYLSETATLFFEISDVNVLNMTDIMINENPITGKNTRLDGLSGNLKIEIKSSQLKEHNFYFDITGEESLDIDDTRLDIHIHFVDYEPLRDFNDTFIGYSVFCTADDTGELSTSTYNCHMVFPSSTDFDSLTLPIAPEWKNNWDNERDKEERYLNGIIEQQRFFNGLFMFIVIILTIIVGYYEYVRPRWSN